MFDLFSQQSKDSQPKLVLIHPGQYTIDNLSVSSDCAKKSIAVDMYNSITICGGGRHKTNIISSFTILGNDSDTVTFKSVRWAMVQLPSSDYNNGNGSTVECAAISMENMVLTRLYFKIGTYFLSKKSSVGDEVVHPYLLYDTYNKYTGHLQLQKYIQMERIQYTVLMVGRETTR